MFTFLVVLLILLSLVLIAAILLQAGKGGGLAASFGGATTSDSLIGTRQAGNLLTKVTWWGGGAFLFLAFVLQLMSTRVTVPRSVLDEPFARQPAPTPARTDSANKLPVQPSKPDSTKK